MINGRKFRSSLFGALVVELAPVELAPVVLPSIVPVFVVMPTSFAAGQGHR
ncbi:hypothetical protein ACFXGG_00015 [Streptomyces nigra]|uniref:hypothetical protein n=1 Tax=Streptomyces nigra TaxID=1827580 RepID=UPI00367DC2DB